ncbi:MAG: 4-phosphoerythronate dehydrogenase [Ignavibacteria bacterium]|nr:MAG: 4-phosphoerythronate dehydrogenase [Ignavibacteria bacterium]
MKITADKNILWVKECFSKHGEIQLLDGREITRERIIDTDALLVRSITQVDENLLNGTNVKFVGTATIGDDHIDKDYLNSRGIYFTNAKGCNAEAVTEYVFTALSLLAHENGLNLKDKSIGVIGVGNIGSRVAAAAKALGMKVVKNDPPLKDETKSDEFSELQDALQCDIVTLHVPLNVGGKYNTYHLLNECNIHSLKDGTILINASRGSVVDNKALLKYLKSSTQKILTVIDVWENEPNINKELMKLVDIATPHVAGYSLEGKINGTKIIYKKFCDYFSEPPLWKAEYPDIEDPVIRLESSTLDSQLFRIFSKIYDIKSESNLLKSVADSDNIGEAFDSMRNNYKFRRELKNYKIEGTVEEPLDKFIKTILSFE